MFSRRQVLVAAACLPALRGATAEAARGPTIRIAVDGTSLPISGFDGGDHLTGMIETGLDLVRADLGWTLDYHAMPWKRAQRVVLDGALDALCTRPTPERESLLRFADAPLFTLDSDWAQFSSDNPRAEEIRQIKTFDQLKSFRIGLGLGNSWPNELMKGEGWQITEVVSLALVDGMVRANHIDMFFENPMVSRYWERANGKPPLEAVHLDILPGGTVPYTFCLRRSFPDCERLIGEFNRAQERLRASGAIDRALNAFTA